MNGELMPGTYRGANGDLIHCRDDSQGRTLVDVEHHDGSLTWADVTVLREAVRASDDPDWPLWPSALRRRAELRLTTRIMRSVLPA